MIAFNTITDIINNMKNIDILNLNQALSGINLKGVKFNYAVAKNLNLLKPEVEALAKARQPDAEYHRFEGERVELAKKFAQRDELGKPVVDHPTQSYVLSDQEGFDAEFEKLKKAHRKAIEAREKQGKEFDALLEKSAKLKLHKIAIKDVPDDINTKQMTAIMTLIEE